MSMYGANPEQLSALGQAMKQQITAIDGVVNTVNAALGGTSWEGPARRQFENDWNMTFRSALTRLNEAFEAAGNDCVKRSNALQQVMG